MSLYNLADELLLIIFNYCDIHDIIQLNGVCKRFYRIASEFLIKESNNLLVTGQRSEKFRERYVKLKHHKHSHDDLGGVQIPHSGCQPLLSSYRDKFSICYNWKHGRYESKIFCSESVSHTMFTPYDETYRNYLQITKDVILTANHTKFTSNDISHLRAFNRTKNGLVSHDNLIVGKCGTEIVDIFVPRNDVIVTNHNGGSIRQWTIESLDGRKYFNEKLLCSSYSNEYFDYPMDVTPQNIIRSTPTSEIEVWKYIPEENSIMDKYTIPGLNLNPNLEPHVTFITFNPTGTKFAAGISSIVGEPEERVIIYDISKCCTEINVNAKDLHALDLNLWYIKQVLWTKPNDILYLMDNEIIKLDVRTHKVVQKWDLDSNEISLKYDFNHYDETLTCMSSDKQYAIMTGTSHGRVILWDQRQSNFIQVYDEENVGYVNCLQFDSSRMYVAADNLYEFDFTKI